MTASFFTLSLLLGFQHALEADHIGAIVGIKRRSPLAKNLLIWELLSNAGHWAIGHGLVLILAAIAIDILNLDIPTSITQASEVVVGVILCLFGARFFKSGPLTKANSPTSSELNKLTVDNSTPKPKSGERGAGSTHAFLFGMLHGFAGSGVLFVIFSTTGGHQEDVLPYALVFSMATLGGMIFTSLFIAWLITKSASRLAGFTAAINRIIGSALLLIGGALICGNFESVYLYIAR
jgi:sulfite exporter TauE/SafE